MIPLAITKENGGLVSAGLEPTKTSVAWDTKWLEAHGQGRHRYQRPYTLYLIILKKYACYMYAMCLLDMWQVKTYCMAHVS